MFDTLNQIFNKIINTMSTLPDNELFIGLIFTGIVSALVYMSRRLPAIILKLIQNNLSIQITFPSYASTQVLTFIESLPHIIGPKSYDISLDPSQTKKKLGDGIHFRKYRGKILIASIEINYSEYTGDHYIKSKLSIFSRNRSLIDLFLVDMYRFNYHGDIQIKTSYRDMWMLRKSIIARPMDSLFYSDNLKENILHDFEAWLNNKKTYQNLSIPYKRGYLFYGKPGTGKTSLIPCIAERLNKVIYYLEPSNIMGDTELLDLMSSIEKNSLLVVEDVDIAVNFKKRENDQNNNENKGITFSGLLNALDGIVACEDVLIIFTTNHPDNIDPALLRSGRIDKKFEFKYLDFETLKNMAEYYGVSMDDEELKSWVPISPAKAQDKLIHRLTSL